MTAQTTWQGWWVFFHSGTDCISSLRSLENQNEGKNQTPGSSSASKSSSFISKVRVIGITAVKLVRKIGQVVFQSVVKGLY